MTPAAPLNPNAPAANLGYAGPLGMQASAAAQQGLLGCPWPLINSMLDNLRANVATLQQRELSGVNAVNPVSSIANPVQGVGVFPFNAQAFPGFRPPVLKK